MGKIGIFVSIFILSKEIFIYSIITSIIVFILTKKKTDYEYSTNKELRKLDEEKTGLTSEMIRGARDIKVLNADESILDKISEKIKEIVNKNLSYLRKFAGLQMVIGSCNDLISFFYIVLSVQLRLSSVITTASFVTLYYYRGRSHGLLNDIASLLSYLKEFRLSYERVDEIIGNHFDKEKFGRIKVDTLKGNIEFKNVSFAYNKNTKVLEDISFKIKANQKVAFVGKSGSGKSTILSLISKLYKVNDGDILLDGYNINDLTKNSIRNNMSLITHKSIYI